MLNHTQEVIDNIENAKGILDALDVRSDHTAGQGILDASNAIQRVQTLLDSLIARQGATRGIKFLKESKVDYLLLLYLQLPVSIRKRSELIAYLESICAQLGINFQSRHFFDHVWGHFEREGVSPISPEKYITTNKKDEAITEYEKIKKSWGKHNPLFLQTYDTKDGKFVNNLYHIVRTVQDGALRLLDILKAGGFVWHGRLFETNGAFEHVIGPSTLCCQLYDCELMSNVFETKQTEEIKEMVQCFPQCICGLMISEDLIDIENIVTFTVKDRTRRISDEKVKISFHFIPNICAPKELHKVAAEIYLGGCKGRITEAAACIKSTGILPETLLLNGISDSILALDHKAFNNGVTTAFSRKKGSDPYSRFVYSDVVCAGTSVERHEYLKEPQDLEGPNLTDGERLFLIYTQLYTAPKREMLSYNADALEAMDKKIGVAKPTPHPQRVIRTGDVGRSTGNLPAWFLSALKEVTGREVSDVRSELPFLQKLRNTLPEASRGASLYHIPSSWCAESMANDKVHIHDKNATVIAVDSRLDVVYATCTTGAHKITGNNSKCIKIVNMYSGTNEDGTVQPVESVGGKCVHWVMADEGTMRLLVETG